MRIKKEVKKWLRMYTVVKPDETEDQCRKKLDSCENLVSWLPGAFSRKKQSSKKVCRNPSCMTTL